MIQIWTMDPLIIPATNTTPYVNFDASSGDFKISGRSTPEHPSEYYAQVNTWVDKYVHAPGGETHISIYFEYFNTSSSKCILEILKKLSSLRASGSHVAIEWFYEKEDEDMKDAGLDFSEILKVPFKLTSKPEI